MEIGVLIRDIESQISSSTLPIPLESDPPAKSPQQGLSTLQPAPPRRQLSIPFYCAASQGPVEEQTTS